ncbi:MAG: hypothetical protein U9N82_06180 [Thermodesulfobacteriota bacterium]|nr:hypothetical protein [Thermodesulfobacteriota bacterium]
METNKDVPLIGIVASRECPTCGHHEVGLTTPDGNFYPLKPGTLVQALGDPDIAGDTAGRRQLPTESHQDDTEELVYNRPWVPDPVKGYPSLRLKYGVFVDENTASSSMTKQIYQAAYLEKLQRLIANELYTPLAVILDRFFNTPHLASGSPKQMAFAMWEELEEIRQPIDTVKAWIDNPDDERIAGLIQAGPEEDLGEVPSDEQIKEELGQMDLEKFLSLL